ncbi:MAG: hypothetical protein ABRQ27_07200 [Clostridiaceae bacterium]
MTDLQQFVIKFFDTLGAAVVEAEYALIDVLIDEKYKNIFGKTELKLCFDYEVYLENHQYELITFGSFILDKIIHLSFNISNTSIRYVVVNNLNLTEPENKIKKFKNLDRTNVEILEERKVMNYFVKYSFKISYISDNTIEEFEDVVIDMNSISISEKFSKNLNNIFYERKQQYHYPLDCNIDFLDGFKEALKEIESIKAFKSDRFSGKLIIKREIERINQYYNSLKFEAEKRMKRKNLSEDKISEYEHKIKIYNIEKYRQINEMEEKYRVKSQITFQNAVVYAVPMICFKYKLSGRNKPEGEFQCLYNIALKDFQ